MFLSVFSDELFMDAKQGLPIIKSWGLDYVDFRGRVNGKGIEYQTDEELRELKKQLDDLGLKVGAIQSSLCKVHLPDAQRRKEEEEKLEGVIRAADVLGCRLVRCFNYWQPHEEQEAGSLVVHPDEMDKVLNMFAPIAKRAKEANLVLAFENCGQTVEEVLAVVDALGVPEWGLAWDVSNHIDNALAKDEAYANAYFERCLKYSRMLHVKAISIVPEFEGTKAPWERILRAALTTGRDMPVSIETHRPKECVDMTHEECTRKTTQLIQKVWPSAAPGGSIADALKVIERFERPYADNPVTFVVVGLGMGKNRCRQLKETSGCKLYGVVDIDEERARACSEAFDVPYSTDINTFLNDPAVEVMYVVTPTGLHGEVVEQCLHAGKHVLTTKPMDVTAQKCRSMIELAKKKNLLLGVDFDVRQNEGMMELHEAVKNGWFGHLLYVNATENIQRTQNYYDEHGAWRGTWRYDGGGAMCNQGIHMVDELQLIFGMPKRVRANIKTQAHVIETEDVGFAEWDYGTQFVVRFFASTNLPMAGWYSRLEAVGSQGIYVSSSGGPEGNGVYYGKNDTWTKEPPYPAKRKWRQASDAFASAIRLNTPIPVDGEEGLKSRLILDAMYKSSTLGGEWVEVK